MLACDSELHISDEQSMSPGGAVVDGAPQQITCSLLALINIDENNSRDMEELFGEEEHPFEPQEKTVAVDTENVKSHCDSLPSSLEEDMERELQSQRRNI